MRRQKIIFDLDGTLTDFSKYIQNNAIPYFRGKYHMNVIAPNALEIEEIFDMQNTLMQRGNSLVEAEKFEKKMINQFWVSHRFLKFSLLTRFRKGAGRAIQSLKRNGFDIEIYSSRSKTCEKNMVGTLSRLLSIWQCWLNGAFLQKESIHFYPNDTEKVKGILQSEPLIVFEDKPWMIERLTEEGINIVGVLTPYNRMVLDRKVQWIDGFAGGGGS